MLYATENFSMKFVNKPLCQLISVQRIIKFLTFLMSEQDKKMVENAVEPPENNKNNLENCDDDLDEVEQVNEEEFQSINDQLDQLNMVLDTLETKNDNIHAQLIELLKSNIEARKQFQESQNLHHTNNKETNP